MVEYSTRFCYTFYMSIFEKLLKTKPSAKQAPVLERNLKPSTPLSEMSMDEKFSYYSSSSFNHLKNANFGLYRNARYDMAEICWKEQKFNTALKLYCEVVYWDMSGLSNGGKHWLSPKNADMCSFDLEYSISNMYSNPIWQAFCAPACRNRIVGIQKKLDLSNTEMRDLVTKYMSEFSAPFHPLSSDDCSKLLVSIITDPEKMNKTVLTNGSRRIREEISALKASSRG